MPKQNLKQTAYATIREKIIKCEYEPGAFLTEDVLCEELGMSRTPVRDALGRLEQEGLIKILPKKGFLVTQMSLNEINMVYEGRLLVEPYIIRNYCTHMPDEILLQMQASVKELKEEIEGKRERNYNSDYEFHMCMIGRCTNNYLRSLYENLHTQNVRISVLGGENLPERPGETVLEHKAILDALIRQDVQEASENMRIHLVKSKEAMFKMLMNRQPYV